MSQETLIMIIAAAMVALIIGFLLGRSSGGASTNGKAAKQAQAELNEYKAAVSEYFGKTADLVDNLTASYKDVFDHLGTSAKTLLSEEEVNKHLTSRSEKAVTLTYLSEAASAASDKVVEKTEVAVESAEAVVADVKADANEVKEAAVEVKEDAADAVDAAKETVQESAESVKEVVTEAGEKLENTEKANKS